MEDGTIYVETSDLLKKKVFSVVISGMPSVGKSTAADAIANSFNLVHLGGGDMLKELAEELGYSPGGVQWWDSEEGLKFMLERKKNSSLDREVDKRLIQRIRRGGVVVTSYPIPWLSKSGLRLWFEASPKVRAQRLAGRDSLPISQALGIIKQRDLGNWKLYKNLYSIDFGRDLSVFNYKIDTEKLNAKEVAKISVELVKNYQKSQPATSRHRGKAFSK